jgi:hypothetical protein
MKLIKMSLAAAMLIGVNSYAFENMEFGGDAKLFYGTIDSGDTDLFHKDGAAGNAAASVDAEYNNKEKAVAVTAGITYLTTMGLENTLVSGTWAGNTVEDQVWIDELKLTISPIEKTTAIVGRQYIDTPLAFSETWNIVSNSMDAVVIEDTHIPDTTLVGAWIGRGNGTAGFQVVDNNSTDMNLGGNYNSYGSAIVNAAGLNIASKGAYSVGAVTKLVPLTTLQAWYYDVESIAKAYWLQADVDFAGFTIGGQYASVNPSENVDVAAGAALDDTTGYAFKIGFAPRDTGFSVSAAYSDVDDGNSPVQLANTATGAMNGAQSKLYTEAWWNFGYVGASGTTAYNIVAEYANDIADLGLYYTSADNDAGDMMEVTASVSKSFGGFDTSLAYIFTDADNDNNGDSYNNIQVYLTYNF